MKYSKMKYIKLFEEVNPNDLIPYWKGKRPIDKVIEDLNKLKTVLFFEYDINYKQGELNIESTINGKDMFFDLGKDENTIYLKGLEIADLYDLTDNIIDGLKYGDNEFDYIISKDSNQFKMLKQHKFLSDNLIYKYSYLKNELF